MQQRRWKAPLYAVLLLSIFTVSARAEFYNVAAPSETDFTDYECFLPCQFGNDDNIISSITWYGKLKGMSDYHQLSDGEFWHDNTGLTFSNGGISNCESMGDDEYDCALRIGHCDAETFEGHYYCQVINLLNFEQYIMNSTIEPEMGEVPDSELGDCFFPSAENITATLTRFANGSSYINVTWDQTIKPRVDRPLNYTYCDLSRQWLIRVLNFSSPDEVEDGDRRLVIGPDVPFETVRRRETHYRLPEDVQYDQYYLIQLKNHRRDGTGGDFVYRNYSSYLFYFGQQEKVSYQAGGAEAITVLFQKELTIDCHSRGIPTPSKKLIRHGKELALTNGVYSISHIEERHAGVYYCSSSNTVVYPPPRGKYKHTVNKAVTVQLTMPVNYTMEVSCKYYNDAMCRTYIRRSTKIAYNKSSSQASLISTYDSQINVIASDLRTMLASSETNSKTAHITDDLITKCFHFASAMDCHTIYPYCDASSTLRYPVPRPICKHSCAVFAEGGSCEFFLDPEVLPDNSDLPLLKQLLLSKCDTRVNPAGTTPECVYVSFESPQIDSAEQIKQTQCVKGDGRGYGGDIFYSVTGTPCQAWFSQTPHQHSIQPEHFPVELFTAGFSCRNPGGLGERPWCYTTSEAVGKRWEYCDIPQCEVCEDYNLKFCSSLPGYNDTKVYINNEQGLNLADIEHKMSGLYFPLIDTLSAGCQLALRQIICHTALPFCKTQSAPTPQKVCSDHCVLLNELRYCPENVLTELEKHWSGEASRTGKYYRPDCSIINGGDEECMPTPVRLQSTADKHTDCFNQTDSGQSYTGTVSVTILGEPCLPWISSDQSANSSFTVDLFPELAGAENYCRNPGQLQYVPWCITNRTSQSFGLCDIDTCTIMTAEGKGITEQGSRSPEWVGPVVFLVIGIPALIAFVIVIILVIRRASLNKNGRWIGSSPPQLERCTPGQDNLRNVKYHENNQYNMVSLNRPLSPKVVDAIISFPQVPQDKIEYVKQLGQGFYGVVFKGKAEMLLEGEKETYVAVKTLKEDDTNEGVEAFVNEAKLMFSFDHPNIVKILGVSMTKTPYYLIFEFMDKGDLTQFLRDNASSLQRRFLNPMDRPRSRTESTLSDDPASLNVEQLTDICKQIASGMQYLSDSKYVHRDLACRNCLVKSVEDGVTASKVIVKIGDFGLSHNLYSKDYYRVRGQAVLPIRWMSPEAIIYGKFSTAGDVWSYGVVMWEIFTFGLQPYYGTSNEEVMEKVRHGKLLQKPTDNCPNKIYSIMTDCWQKEDQNRPSFTEILGYLNECRASISSDEDMQSLTSCDYDYEDSDAFELNSDIENDQVRVEVN